MPLENQLHKKSGIDPLSGGDERGMIDQVRPFPDMKQAENKQRRTVRTVVIAGLLFMAIAVAERIKDRIFNEKNASNVPAAVIGPERWERPGPRSSQRVGRYSASLLDGMALRMEEMGYGKLSHEELARLRDLDLTATWIGQIRDAGFPNLTIDEAIRMKNRDVSARFLSMMKALGYQLSVDDVVRLKDASVTANYTSQMADLGYRNLSIDQLIEMKTIGVTRDQVRKLTRENGGQLPPLQDVIRHRISNQ